MCNPASALWNFVELRSVGKRGLEDEKRVGIELLYLAFKAKPVEIRERHVSDTIEQKGRFLGCNS